MLLQARRWFELSKAVNRSTSKVLVCRWKYANKGMLRSLWIGEYEAIKIIFLVSDSPFYSKLQYKTMQWRQRDA